MTIQGPYCGAAPSPYELLGRFNVDPVLIAALIIACAVQLWMVHRGHAAKRRPLWWALSGWVVASAALISPLCALSVALFSARVAQHMILLLVAAPLIAAGLPSGRSSIPSWPLWCATAAFFLALWFWHMPLPYASTFVSASTYWAMHVSLVGSGVLLWHELMSHSRERLGQVLAAGTLTCVHMGLLGAVLALADRPLFFPHLLTTQAWGLSPLQDQQLGGSLMWVPAIAVFLWVALRSLSEVWEALERARPA